MSEDKSNGICTICGGMLRIAYIIAFEQCRPKEIKVNAVPSGFVRLCPGHFPEQDTMHDGRLDTINAATVSLKDELYVQIDDTHDLMILSASQALSLLTWLLQERRHLEEIAAQVERPL